MEKPTGKAKGGAARAAKLTPERRKEIAQRAADAKRELALLPQTTHVGTLKLKFLARFNQDIVSAEIPHFLARKSLIPFINKHLGHLQNIVLNISPRIPPARRTDAKHPQCESTTSGGGQADGFVCFALVFLACSSVPCAST